MDLISQVCLNTKADNVLVFLYTKGIIEGTTKHSENAAVVNRLRLLNPSNLIVFYEDLIASFTSIDNWANIQYDDYIVRCIDMDNDRELKILERLIKEDILSNADTRLWTMIGHKYLIKKKALSNTGGYYIYDRMSIDVNIDSDRRILIGFDSSYSFEYTRTLAQELSSNDTIQAGTAVKDPYCGYIYEYIGIAPFTIGESNEYLGCSIIEYYNRKNASTKIQGVSPNTRALLVKTYDGRLLPYSPTRLKRLCTYGTLPSNIIRHFKKDIQRTPNDKIHFMIDTIVALLATSIKAKLGKEDIIKNITPTALGYDTVTLQIPELLFGNNYSTKAGYGNIIRGLKQAGLYKAPPSIELRYFIDTSIYHDKELLSKVNTLRQDMDKLSNTMGIAINNVSLTTGKPSIDYDLIDMNNEEAFKNTLERLSKDNVFKSPTMVIFTKEHLEKYYPVVKQILGGHNSITTQCLDFDKYSKLNNKESALINILLGIYAKNKIVPWRLKQPLHSDCFIGLDISRKQGHDVMGAIQIIGPKGSIIGGLSDVKGETIQVDTLSKIASSTIKIYENEYNKKPTHITFHRDGRCFEDLKALESFMHSIDILYDYVEITKRFNRRVAKYDEANKTWGTIMGSCYIKDNSAILCSTNPNSNIGMAIPIKITRLTNHKAFKDIIEDVWNLSFMHIHSAIKTRLPITTHYADLCSTQGLYGYLPSDMDEGFLYFV